MKTLLKRITAILPTPLTSNIKEVIMSIAEAFLDGVFMLEMYSSKSGIGIMFVKFSSLLDSVSEKLSAAQFDSDMKKFKEKLTNLEKDLSNSISDQTAVQVHDIRRDQGM